MKTTEELISELIEQKEYAVMQLDELANNMIYNGNSVGYIYSKAENYKNCIGRCWDAVKEYGIECDGKKDIADAIRELGDKNNHT